MQKNLGAIVKYSYVLNGLARDVQTTINSENGAWNLVLVEELPQNTIHEKNALHQKIRFNNLTN